MVSMMGNLLIYSESKTLEFKRDLSSPKPLLKTLVAFANTARGCLIIDITDDQSIAGVDKEDTQKYRLRLAA